MPPPAKRPRATSQAYERRATGPTASAQERAWADGRRVMREAHEPSAPAVRRKVALASSPPAPDDTFPPSGTTSPAKTLPAPRRCLAVASPRGVSHGPPWGGDLRRFRVLAGSLEHSSGRGQVQIGILGKNLVSISCKASQFAHNLPTKISTGMVVSRFVFACASREHHARG